MKYRLLAMVLAAWPVAALAVGHPSATAFAVTSPDLKDDGIMPTQMASDGKARDGNACGGENVSPGLAWSHAPAGTKSFAVTMFDGDGAGGVGVSHWVAYGIPGTAKGFARGEASKAGPGFVGGANQRGITIYMGPCPPAGDAWHHYVLQVYALDVPADQLQPGLNREQLFAAVKGHLLGEASLIARYTR
jgi:Raf kinase inhibitor-like YbhB/YbcL family protein